MRDYFYRGGSSRICISVEPVDNFIENAIAAPGAIAHIRFSVPYTFGIELKQNDVLVFGQDKPGWFLEETLEDIDLFNIEFADRGATITIAQRNISAEGMTLRAYDSRYSLLEFNPK